MGLCRQGHPGTPDTGTPGTPASTARFVVPASRRFKVVQIGGTPGSALIATLAILLAVAMSFAPSTRAIKRR